MQRRGPGDEHDAPPGPWMASANGSPEIWTAGANVRPPSVERARNVYASLAIRARHQHVDGVRSGQQHADARAVVALARERDRHARRAAARARRQDAELHGVARLVGVDLPADVGVPPSSTAIPPFWPVPTGKGAASARTGPSGSSSAEQQQARLTARMLGLSASARPGASASTAIAALRPLSAITLPPGGSRRRRSRGRRSACAASGGAPTSGPASPRPGRCCRR